MLTCIYHPIDPFRVVEETEATRLKALGIWFDCPKKAQAYRDGVEDKIKNESLKPVSSTADKFKGKRK